MPNQPKPRKPDVCMLYLDKFPIEVKQQAKARALHERKTLFEWILRLVKTELAKKPG